MPDHSCLSPAQQAIASDEPGTYQDAVHEARAAVATGSREFVVAGGRMYRICEDPVPGELTHVGFGGQAWIVTWPDGTEQRTRNLWSWQDTDLPDNAVLRQEPFWTGLPGMDPSIEYLLAPAPLNVVPLYADEGLTPPPCIIDEREHWYTAKLRARKEPERGG